MNPATPLDEGPRLAALERYRIVDSLREPEFDDIAELASVICGTPIALISFVDRSRQWFKSHIGFELTETAREVSFCGHAILSSNTMVIEDATRDVRFADNPLVTGNSGIRFYAGTPLRTPDKHEIGTLCVMDKIARKLSDEQRLALEVLSRQVISRLELRLRQRELEESEGRLKMVTENARIGLVILNIERKYIYANRSYGDILGIAVSNLVGMSVAEVLPDVYENQIKPRLDSAFTGKREAYELRRKQEGGEMRYIVRYEPMFESGAARFVVVTVTDVTEQMTALAAARLMEAIVESSDDAIIGKNLDSIVTSWNPGAERIFGYAAAEMIGFPINKIIPLDRNDEEALIIAQLRAGHSIKHFETVRVRRDGRLINVSVTASPIRDPSGAVVGASKIARDITDRMRIEEERRASDLRYRALFEYAPDGILIADSKSTYLDANASICQMLGYTRGEIVGMNATDIVASSELLNVKPALDKIQAGDAYRREWRLRRRDGTQFPADIIAAQMPDGNILAMIRDVTQGKRAEARYRRLVDSNVQGVMFWNAAGEVIGANDAFLSIVGYTRAEFEGSRLVGKEITPPEFANLDRQAAQAIEAQSYCAPYEKEFFRKDGSRAPVLIGAAAFDDGSGDGICFVVDLSDRKKIEKQFLRAQRMESIGTMAGGIAHDLNNLLVPIMLGVDLLRQFSPDEESLPIIETIEQSATRGQHLVKQILSFARGAEGSRIPVSLAHVVREVEEIAISAFPRNITFDMRLPKDLWMVSADPTQLNQVLLNLCVNARDAMPDGGRIEISLSNVEIDAQYAVMYQGVAPGRYVLMKVADTGQGIPKEIIDRIFEPFFTTKEIGKGTGLGLSTVMGITRSHGGFVNVYSEPGKGTIFKVHLPAQLTLGETPAEPPVELLPRGNGELILVVDDQASVLAITKQTLEAFGYRVVTAEDGAHAIAIYATQPDKIAVVLTDMMMPVMDGSALIAAILRIRPKAHIVAASGLEDNGVVTRLAHRRMNHFLAKPFSAGALVRIIASALSD